MMHTKLSLTTYKLQTISHSKWQCIHDKISTIWNTYKSSTGIYTYTTCSIYCNKHEHQKTITYIAL